MKLSTIVSAVGAALVRHWGWSLIAAAAGAVGVMVTHIHHDKPLPQDVAVDVGLAKALQPIFQAQVDTARKAEAAAKVRVVHDTVEDAEAAADAAFYHARADSLEAIAIQQGDSVGSWKALAQDRKAEVAALAADTTAKAHTIVDLRSQLTAVSARAAAYEGREISLDRLNGEVVTALTNGDCRVVGVFDCPSRKASYAAGVATPAVLAGAYLIIRAVAK